MKEVNYSFERLQVDFDERDHIRNAIAQLKKTHAISGCRVLELGSGAGANLAILQPENEVLGVEGLADAAAHATRLGVNTLVANLDNALPLESAQYDWVLCLDVLEHLLSPDTALREAHRLLKPDQRPQPLHPHRTFAHVAGRRHSLEPVFPRQPRLGQPAYPFFYPRLNP